MRLLTLIEFAAPPLFFLAVIGFFMLFACVLRLVLGRNETERWYWYEKPYISICLLFIPIFLIMLSRQVAFKTLEHSATDESILVRVTPKLEITSKQFVGLVIDNIYYNKGAAGSRPTENLYTVELCFEEDCYEYIVSQDSIDTEMYWVSFIPFSGVDYPLGFTRLANEKI